MSVRGFTVKLPLALVLAIILATTVALGWAKPVLANGWVEWRNASSNKCLDVPGNVWYSGQKVQQYACNGGQNQLWTLVVWSPHYVSICGQVGPPYCIGRQANAANGAKAILVPEGPGLDTRWYQTLVGGVYTQFESLLDNRCLDDPGYSNANGTWMQVYDCNGGSNQTWYWTHP